MRKYKNVLKVIIVVLITLMCFSKISYVYGMVSAKVPLTPSGEGNSGSSDKTPSTIAPIEDPITNPDFYRPGNVGGTELFMEKANTIISGIRLVGTLIAVIAVIGMGIKYMLASASERAQYKETMIPYIIGAIMLFTISNVLGILYDLVKEINI